MSVGSGSSDFVEYTKEWMSRVNRGGLFPLNKKLPHTISKSNSRQEIYHTRLRQIEEVQSHIV